MDQVAEVLTAGTDSICVHSIGYTLTLYRYIVSSLRFSTLQWVASAWQTFMKLDTLDAVRRSAGRTQHLKVYAGIARFRAH
jgi:hypothetical protein